jgi:hypothetical protein
VLIAINSGGREMPNGMWRLGYETVLLEKSAHVCVRRQGHLPLIIMIDNTMSTVLSNMAERQLAAAISSQVTSSSPNTITSIMNGVIKRKLNVITKDLM